MSSTDIHPSQQRHVLSKRLRISRACDRCKKRKIRCTGTQPCEVCTRDEAGCIYAAPHKRGRKSYVAASNFSSFTVDTVQQGSITVDGVRRPENADQHQHQQLEPIGDESFDLSSTAVRQTSSRASPEPITDLQGHYVGPASGVSFLARVQERLHYGNHTPSNFTFGDAPLPDYEATPSIMVSKDEATRLVQKFFDFTVPIDRLLHRPTIEQWLQEFCDTMGSMRDPVNAPTRRAIIWMIFAMAQEHMPADPNTTVDDRSIRYFLAADYQLSKDRGTVSLASVQARLYQCFWLLSRSRMNHCWALFGSAARLALALGLHRKRSSHVNNGYSPLDLDCCRRTFWSAYCLDTHLSLTLGRPRIFHDEDIDQQLPSGADDSDLLINSSAPPSALSYSVMLAPVSYYRLHRILTMILRDLYSIRPLSTVEQCDLSKKYTQYLKEWRDEVPNFLQVDSKTSPPLIPIFQRQRDVLNFTYWHAVMVTCRPLLLKNFAQLQHTYDSHTAVTSNSQPRIDESVNECLQAAMSIVDRVDQMFESGRMFRSFWATCYYGFCAAAILYVYTIQQGSLPLETYQVYFDAATRSQSKLSRFIESGSLITRYCLMLEELRLEALRQIESEATTNRESVMAVARMNAMAAEFANIIGAPVPYPTVDGHDFASAPADITTWMQFEHLDSEHSFCP